ncbi:hypothetical protein HS088_TW04G00367 [Tripterygium wilfordii]|uniref:Transmembrane protein n=1 Tax=Tripterygium wilfordii TaxID=458696 RepID=A0A7J7DQ35_TRIWF|nr:hypothetical protein HS088_TW04G00367 [Tripterygium wilfordii]
MDCCDAMDTLLCTLFKKATELHGLSFLFLVFLWSWEIEMAPMNGEDTYRDLHQPALITAGCFVIVALALSILLILQHLRHYTNPAEQKWIVGVLLMVPIYACESIISLWNPKLSLVCDILRNCYEAFALYSFWSYLVACLGGERRVIEILENESRRLIDDKPLLDGADKHQDRQQRSFSNFFFRPGVLGRDLYTIIKFGLVQYMILKTFCAFLAFLLELFGVYGDGEFKWYYGLCEVQFSFLVDQMAIAAVAHVYVFSVEPYHYVPASNYGRVTTDTTRAPKLEDNGEKKPTVLEKTETQVNVPGTSVTESVQDIVVEGGQRVVKDVVLTINQAIGPVEKGVAKIQERFHHRSVGSVDKEEESESELEIKELFEENDS